MKLVTPALRHLVYPGLARTGYLRRRSIAGPAVITYHGVFPQRYRLQNSDLDGNLITANTLRLQLRLLKTHYNVISPDDFLLWCRGAQPLPPRSVLLTCDDGLQNVLTDMLPLLQEHGFSCLFFATGISLRNEPSMLWYEELYLMLREESDVSDLNLPEIDFRGTVAGNKHKRSLWWDLVQAFSRFSPEARAALLQQVRTKLGLSVEWNSRYAADESLRGRFFVLKLPELRELSNSGMCIGAHTMSHPMLSRQPAELAGAEISDCKRSLEQALNREIWALAYPFGDPASAGPREFAMAERSRFTCAFLNIEDVLRVKPTPFAFPRIHVTANMALSEFEAHVSGFHKSLHRRFAGDSWAELTA